MPLTAKKDQSLALLGYYKNSDQELILCKLFDHAIY